MMSDRKDVKCPWCGAVVSASEFKVTQVKKDSAAVVERRCSKCDKILAAYVEGEHDFLPRIRTF